MNGHRSFLCVTVNHSNEEIPPPHQRGPALPPLPPRQWRTEKGRETLSNCITAIPNTNILRGHKARCMKVRSGVSGSSESRICAPAGSHPTIYTYTSRATFAQIGIPGLFECHDSPRSKSPKYVCIACRMGEWRVGR